MHNRRRAIFEGRVAVVTGSSRGIGRETARLLAELGASVVLNGRDPERLGETLRAFERSGLRCAAMVGDAAEEASAQALVACALERFGRLDILVNNAGLSMRGRFAATTHEVWEGMLHANLTSAIVATGAALPEIRKRRGSVLFISSIAGCYGFPGVVAYSVAKMGLTALQQGLDAELARDGVHVGIIYLGFTQNDPDKRIVSASGESIASKRPHTHTQREVARRIVHLLRRRRAAMVLTGAGAFVSMTCRLAPWLLRWWAIRSDGRVHRSPSI